MTLRSGHGKMRGSPRIEVLPPDELPSAMGSTTDRPERDGSGRFMPGNRAGLANRLRPGPLGGVDTADPSFRPFRNWGRRYAIHRRAELAAAHGGVISAGAGAIVESAALALAASRFAQSKGAETGDIDLLKRAGDLSALARQHELAAWEICAREAASRPKAKRLPWAAVTASTPSEPSEEPTK